MPIADRYWEGRWRDEARENDRLNELLRTAKIDASLAHQLQRSIARNGKLVIALREAIDYLEQNGLPVEAAEIRTQLANAIDTTDYTN